MTVSTHDEPSRLLEQVSAGYWSVRTGANNRERHVLRAPGGRI